MNAAQTRDERRDARIGARALAAIRREREARTYRRALRRIVDQYPAERRPELAR